MVVICTKKKTNPKLFCGKILNQIHTYIHMYLLSLVMNSYTLSNLFILHL